MNTNETIQEEFEYIFWTLLMTLPKHNPPSNYKEKFQMTLEELQHLIDDGADINMEEDRIYFKKPIDAAINLYISKIYPGHSVYAEEIVYFLLSQKSLQLGFSTIRTAARDSKLTEDILRRCDDEMLDAIDKRYDGVTPSLLEVFQGFGLKMF